MASVNKDEIEALKARIIKSAINCSDQNSCWNWILSKQRNGYGQMKFQGKMHRAHRVSYMAFVGEIKAGLEVMHSCDNRQCVNPRHLSTGTHQQNMSEIATKGRTKRGSDHPSFGRPGRTGSQSSQSIPVEINGVAYGGHKEAERALNVAHGSVRYWIKTGKATVTGAANGK